MGVFKKILNPLTKGQTLQDRMDEFDRLCKEIKSLEGTVTKKAESLYNHRKEDVRLIQELQHYAEKLPNCPDVIIQGIRRAYSYTGVIRRAATWEDQQFDIQDVESRKDKGNVAKGVAGAAGAIAGGLTAITGPSAAMAIATTFGTASTGAAISALGGAAATNAALAWLGGGAVAAGGAGIAGGSALLAALGPIGWGLAGVSIITTTALSRSKNAKAIKEVEEIINKLKARRYNLTRWGQRLSEIIKETSFLENGIACSQFKRCPTDFSNDKFPKEALFEAVSKAKLLGKLSNEAIDVTDK